MSKDLNKWTEWRVHSENLTFKELIRSRLIEKHHEIYEEIEAKRIYVKRN